MKTLHVLQNTDYKKCCNVAQHHQKLVFYNFSFLKDKALMMNKKHNLR